MRRMENKGELRPIKGWEFLQEYMQFYSPFVNVKKPVNVEGRVPDHTTTGSKKAETKETSCRQIEGTSTRAVVPAVPQTQVEGQENMEVTSDNTMILLGMQLEEGSSVILPEGTLEALQCVGENSVLAVNPQIQQDNTEYDESLPVLDSTPCDDEIMPQILCTESLVDMSTIETMDVSTTEIQSPRDFVYNPFRIDKNTTENSCEIPVETDEPSRSVSPYCTTFDNICTCDMIKKFTANKDVQYLLSWLPDMEEMNPKQKKEFKLRVMGLFDKVLDNVDLV